MKRIIAWIVGMMFVAGDICLAQGWEEKLDELNRSAAKIMLLLAIISIIIAGILFCIGLIEKRNKNKQVMI